MNSTKGILFLFIILCIHTLSFSQTTFITISGKVIDKENSQPIAFANVSIAGKSIGTVTNIDGAFIFKLPALHQSDSLKVSFIGYQSFTRAVTGIGNELLTITLQPAIVELQEVQVKAKAKTALNILQEALAAIPLNYDTSATEMMAFYQEATRLGEEDIVYVESVLDINRAASGNQAANDQIKTVKERRKNIDYSKDIRFYKWLQLTSGPFEALRNSDVVKGYILKSEPSPLNPLNYKHYEYKLNSIINDGYRNMYVIDILPKKKSRKAIFQARFYIDLQTLSFAKTELKLTQAGLNRENNLNLLTKKINSAMVKASFKFSSFEEKATYELYNNKWYLKDVHRDFEGIVNSKSRHMVKRLWKTNFWLTVTDINKEGKVSGKEAIYAAQHSAGKLIGKQKGDNFWAHFNIVRPTSSGMWGDFKEFTDSTYLYKQEVKATDSIPAQLDAYLVAANKTYKFNGSVLVAKSGKVLLHKAFGYKDYRRQTLNDTATRFPILSITKSFTAMVMLKLQEEGKLSLDDGVSKYLPDLPHGEQIKLHHLLTHSSGLYNFTNDIDEEDSLIVCYPVTKQRVVEVFKDKPLEFTPGKNISYNNSGFFLAGMVIEKVTGKAYEQVVQEKIFAPLSMQASGFDFIHLPAQLRATGYQFLNEKVQKKYPFPDSTVLYSAGAIYSTSADMYKWAKAISSQQLLYEESWKLAFNKQVGDYSYVFKLGDYLGKKYIRASGGYPGFMSEFVYYPKQDLTIILLNNYGDYSDSLWPIVTGLTDIGL